MVVVMLVLLVSAGCSRDATQPDTQPISVARSNVPKVSARSSERGVETRRDHDRLITAYAPVSDDASAVSAAGILFADQQIDGRAYLRIIREYDRTLRVAQHTLRRAPVHDSVNVRQQLLSAIASRIDALQSLARYLETREQSNRRTTSSARLQERYRSAWGASIGAARQATNLIQSQRQDAGLEPVSEDVFR